MYSCVHGVPTLLSITGTIPSRRRARAAAALLAAVPTNGQCNGGDPQINEAKGARRAACPLGRSAAIRLSKPPSNDLLRRYYTGDGAPARRPQLGLDGARASAVELAMPGADAASAGSLAPEQCCQSVAF